jgi:hypothetical protein
MGHPFGRRLLVLVLAVAPVVGCAASPAPPPAFEGRETDAWIAYELPVSGRPPFELLRAFRASARALGCRTETLGGFFVRSPVTGVSADCPDGAIALMPAGDDQMRVGCARPMTRAECDALLVRITQAR